MGAASSWDHRVFPDTQSRHLTPHHQRSGGPLATHSSLRGCWTVSASVSWGCCNKLLPTGWLKTTGTYAVSVLEAGIKVLAGRQSLKSPRQKRSCASLQPSGALGCFTPVLASSSSLSASPYKDPVLRLRAHLRNTE